MGENAPNVTFDDEGRLRILDADTFAQTKLLEAEARTFAQRLDGFSESVKAVVSSVSAEAAKVEEEKLKVIGQRVLIMREREMRAARVEAAEGLVEDKRAELSALLAEYLSLASVEQQQRETIEKLMDGLPGAAT